LTTKLHNIFSSFDSLRGVSPSLSDHDEDTDEESSGMVVEKSKVQKPPLYKIIMHNDDYTTMEFVILVLKKFFLKSDGQANEIMLSVHQKGSGICGTYTFEVAETKIIHVNRFSKENGHPLKVTLEEE
jgi:ATP-dependent Clp protease adaptor protein ClpS